MNTNEKIILIDKYIEEWKRRINWDKDIGCYLNYLYDRAITIPYCKVLEFGTFIGSSTLAFLSAVMQNGGFLISVDKNECRDIRSRIGFNPQFSFIHDMTENFKSKYKFDIILIDTDHTYEQVKAECKVIEPLLKYGTLVMFHDPIFKPAIVPAIEEFIARHNCKITKYSLGYGLWEVEILDNITNKSKYYENVEFTTMLNDDRCFVLENASKYCNTIEGDFVECGVYKGGSAYVILQEMDKIKKNLYLFDTFNGIVPEENMCAHKAIDFKDTSIDKVMKLLNNDKAILIRGDVKETLNSFNKPIAFLHIDLDLYDATLQTLSKLYDKVTPGGIIICDDYGFAPYKDGAKKAFDIFFKDKKEKIEPLTTGQCIVIKQ